MVLPATKSVTDKGTRVLFTAFFPLGTAVRVSLDEHSHSALVSASKGGRCRSCVSPLQGLALCIAIPLRQLCLSPCRSESLDASHHRAGRQLEKGNPPCRATPPHQADAYCAQAPAAAPSRGNCRRIGNPASISCYFF
jgi:hypothetical protein